MSYNTSNHLHDAFSERGIARSTSGTPSSSPESLDEFQKNQIGNFFREAKISLEKDLNSCRNNPDLKSRYQFITTKELLMGIPHHIVNRVPVVGMTFEPHSRNILKSKMFLESKVSMQNSSLDSLYTFTPGYVGKINEIQQLFEYIGLNPKVWETILLLVDSLSIAGDAKIVQEFQEIAFSLAEAYLFSEDNVRSQRAAIKTISKFLLPLTKGGDQAVLDFSKHLFIKLAKQENESKGLKSYTTLFIFVREFEKLNNIDHKQWGKECIDSIIDLWNDENPTAIRDLLSAFSFNEHSSDLVAAIKKYLVMKVEGKRETSTSSQDIPQNISIPSPETLMILDREEASPVSPPVNSLIVIQREPSPFEPIRQQSLGKPPFIDSDSKERSIILEKSSYSEDIEPEEQAPGNDPEYKEEKQPEIVPEVKIEDYFQKIINYLKTPRLSTNQGALKKLVEAVEQMSEMDTATWDKVIEAVSKSKVEPLKQRLWVQWNSTNKDGMAAGKVSQLWQKSLPLMSACNVEEVVKYYVDGGFAQLMNQLNLEKDKSKLNNVYKDTLKKVIKHHDVKDVLEEHLNYVREFTGINAHKLFVDEILPVIESLSKRKNASWGLIVNLLLPHVAQIKDPKATKQVLDVFGQVMELYHPIDREDAEALDTLVCLLTNASQFDKMELCEIVSKHSASNYAEKLLLIVDEETKATIDNKRLSEREKEKRLTRLMGCFDLAIESSNAVVYSRNKAIVAESIKRVEAVLKVSAGSRNLQIFKKELESTNPFNLHEIERACDLWRSLDDEHKYESGKSLIDKCLVTSESPLQTNEMVKCIDKLYALFNTKKLVIENGSKHVKCESELLTTLLEQCISKAYYGYPNSREYCNLTIHLLKMEFYQDELEKDFQLSMVFSWIIETFFYKNENGRYYFNDLLDAERIDTFFDILSTVYMSPGISLAIETLTENDESYLDVIQESCLSLITHQTDLSYHAFESYCKGLLKPDAEKNFLICDFDAKISHLHEICDTLWNLIDLMEVTREEVWTTAFDHYIDLLIIFDKFQDHMGKNSVRVEDTIRNLYKDLIKTIDRSIRSDIKEWNKTGEKATTETILRLYFPTNLYLIALESIIETADLSTEDEDMAFSSDIIIGNCLELARRALYATDKLVVKQSIFNNLIEFLSKRIGLANPNIGQISTLASLAQINGVEGAYIMRRDINEERKEYHVNTNVNSELGTHHPVMRRGFLHLTQQMLQSETAWDVLLLLKILENSNLECFYGNSSSPDLVYILNESLKILKNCLSNKAELKRLVDNKVLDSLDKAVFYPLQKKAVHSEKWNGPFIPAKEAFSAEWTILNSISMLTGTEEELVNTHYLNFLKEVAKFHLSLCLQLDGIVEGEDKMDLADPMATLCAFGDILKDNAILVENQLIDLDDPEAFNRLDVESQRMVTLFKSYNDKDILDKLHLVVSFINAP